jgi:hypothetical protein
MVQSMKLVSVYHAAQIPFESYGTAAAYTSLSADAVISTGTVQLENAIRGRRARLAMARMAQPPRLARFWNAGSPAM